MLTRPQLIDRSFFGFARTDEVNLLRGFIVGPMVYVYLVLLHYSIHLLYSPCSVC
jgi:hypothetical protein